MIFLPLLLARTFSFTQQMKRYYRFHQANPHIFANLLPSVEKKVFCSGMMYPSPLRNEEGCRFIIIEAGKRWKPKEISLDQIFKGLIICMKAAMMEAKTQVCRRNIIFSRLIQRIDRPFQTCICIYMCIIDFKFIK